MDNNYSQTLKHLIKFSGVKLSTLADFIGYDVSYISKWCNGINHPSSRYIARINHRISSFITEELIRQGLIYPFFNEFGIKLETQISAEDIKNHLLTEINNLLDNTYYHKQTEKSGSQDSDSPVLSTSSQTITGRTNIKKFLNTKIASVVSDIKESVDIFITGDIVASLMQNAFWDFLDSCCFSAESIDIHIGCDLDRLRLSSPDFIPKLYKMLNKYIYISFHIYDDKKFSKSNIIALKNYFSIQYSIHSDNLIDICTYVTDKKTVKDIWDRTSEKFTYNSCILEPKDDIELVKFRSFFYLNSDLVLFCAKGFEFFLPAAAFKKVLGASCNYKYSSDMQQTIQNMQISWEEQFEKAHIDFFLPEANIMHYIEGGQLNYGEIEYTASVDEREAQLQQLIKSVKNNPNINIYLLSEAQPQSEEDYFKLSYYSNNKTAYLKKNKLFLTHNSKTIYLIKHPILMDKFNVFFHDLKNQPGCCKFSAEDLEKIYKKNNSLLQRIWQKNIPVQH